jgi:hypothetical protein
MVAGGSVIRLFDNNPFRQGIFVSNHWSTFHQMVIRILLRWKTERSEGLSEAEAGQVQM